MFGVLLLLLLLQRTVDAALNGKAEGGKGSVKVSVSDPAGILNIGPTETTAILSDEAVPSGKIYKIERYIHDIPVFQAGVVIKQDDDESLPYSISGGDELGGLSVYEIAEPLFQQSSIPTKDISILLCKTVANQGRNNARTYVITVKRYVHILADENNSKYAIFLDDVHVQNMQDATVSYRCLVDASNQTVWKAGSDYRSNTPPRTRVPLQGLAYTKSDLLKDQNTGLCIMSARNSNIQMFDQLTSTSALPAGDVPIKFPCQQFENTYSSTATCLDYAIRTRNCLQNKMGVQLDQIFTDGVIQLFVNYGDPDEFAVGDDKTFYNGMGIYFVNTGSQTDRSCGSVEVVAFHLGYAITANLSQLINVEDSRCVSDIFSGMTALMIDSCLSESPQASALSSINNNNNYLTPRPNSNVGVVTAAVAGNRQGSSAGGGSSSRRPAGRNNTPRPSTKKSQTTKQPKAGGNNAVKTTSPPKLAATNPVSNAAVLSQRSLGNGGSKTPEESATQKLPENEANSAGGKQTGNTVANNYAPRGTTKRPSPSRMSSSSAGLRKAATTAGVTKHGRVTKPSTTRGSNSKAPPLNNQGLPTKSGSNSAVTGQQRGTTVPSSPVTTTKCRLDRGNCRTDSDASRTTPAQKSGMATTSLSGKAQSGGMASSKTSSQRPSELAENVAKNVALVGQVAGVPGSNVISGVAGNLTGLLSDPSKIATNPSGLIGGLLQGAVDIAKLFSPLGSTTKPSNNRNMGITKKGDNNAVGGTTTKSTPKGDSKSPSKTTTQKAKQGSTKAPSKGEAGGVKKPASATPKNTRSSLKTTAKIQGKVGASKLTTKTTPLVGKSTSKGQTTTPHGGSRSGNESISGSASGSGNDSFSGSGSGGGNESFSGSGSGSGFGSGLGDGNDTLDELDRLLNNETLSSGDLDEFSGDNETLSGSGSGLDKETSGSGSGKIPIETSTSDKKGGNGASGEPITGESSGAEEESGRTGVKAEGGNKNDITQDTDENSGSIVDDEAGEAKRANTVRSPSCNSEIPSIVMTRMATGSNYDAYQTYQLFYGANKFYWGKYTTLEKAVCSILQYARERGGSASDINALVSTFGAAGVKPNAGCTAVSYQKPSIGRTSIQTSANLPARDVSIYQLRNCVSISGLAGRKDEVGFYKFIVSHQNGATTLVVSLRTGKGGTTTGADIFLKYGALPRSLNDYDLGQHFDDSAVTITVSNPPNGDYYVIMQGTSDYSDVSLTSCYV